jgi:hypothetical protein
VHGAVARMSQLHRSAYLSGQRLPSFGLVVVLSYIVYHIDESTEESLSR